MDRKSAEASEIVNVRMEYLKPACRIAKTIFHLAAIVWQAGNCDDLHFRYQVSGGVLPFSYEMNMKDDTLFFMREGNGKAFDCSYSPMGGPDAKAVSELTGRISSFSKHSGERDTRSPGGCEGSIELLVADKNGRKRIRLPCESELDRRDSVWAARLDTLKNMLSAKAAKAIGCKDGFYLRVIDLSDLFGASSCSSLNRKPQKAYSYIRSDILTKLDHGLAYFAAPIYLGKNLADTSAFSGIILDYKGKCVKTEIREQQPRFDR
jgi:hypothetical protein